MPATANLDSQFKASDDFVMTSDYAKGLGRAHEIEYDFEEDQFQSIAGHPIQVTGILRNVPFRMMGSSVTLIRDFYICDALEGWANVFFGSNFMSRVLPKLFKTAKDRLRLFGAWCSAKKKTEQKKAEEERLNLEAERNRAQQYMDRKANEQRKRDAAKGQQSEHSQPSK